MGLTIRTPPAVVLGTLAHAGNSQEQQAEAAYQASVQHLDISGAFPPREACSLQRFDQSLVELAKVSIPIRRKILEACRICVTADQQVTTRERELVRAVAAVLECPTPIAVPRDGRRRCRAPLEPIGKQSPFVEPENRTSVRRPASPAASTW